MKRAATAANCTLRDAFIGHVSVPGSSDIMITRGYVPAAMQTFHRSKTITRRPQSPVCDTFPPSSAGPSLEALSKTLPSLHLPLPQHFSYHFPSLLCCFTPSRRPISAPVVEAASEDYKEAQEISGMVMGGSVGESNETPRYRKQRKVTCKEHSKMRAQALTFHESLRLHSVLQAYVFGR